MVAQNFGSHSWKQKVDPAFPDFIKFYLEFLAITDLPGNKGYLALDGRDEYNST